VNDRPAAGRAHRDNPGETTMTPETPREELNRLTDEHAALERWYRESAKDMEAIATYTRLRRPLRERMEQLMEMLNKRP
jgi:hypothetical protein